MKAKRTQGSAMVEFAMSASLLLPMMTGIFELGQGLYTYNKLQTAVRAGARYASMRTYNSATSTPSAAFQAAVQNVVIYGNPAGGTTPHVANLTPNQVDIIVRMSGNVPAEVTVRVNGFALDTIFGSVILTNKPSSTFAYGGRYTAGY